MKKAILYKIIVFGATVMAAGASTLLVGHRGGDITNTPENTIAAIEDSFTKGVYGHEIDVRETSDGELMLMHDSMVDRTTDGTGAFSSFTAAQLRLLDAGAWKDAAYSGEQVPFFSDALSSIKGNGSRVYIDAPFINSPSTYSTVFSSVGFAESNVTFLTYFNSQSANLISTFADAEVFRSYFGNAYDASTMPAEFSAIEASGVDGVTIMQSQYSVEYVTAIHNAGLKVAVVGFGSSSEAETLGYIANGVDELWYDDLVNNVSKFNDGNGVLTVPEPSSMCFIFIGCSATLIRRR